MIVYTLLSVALPLVCWFIYRCLRIFRQRFTMLPSLKRNPVFGNILEMGPYMKPGRHPDYGLVDIYNELGQPDMFFLDALPVHQVVIITSPLIAEQITKSTARLPYSTAKSYTAEYIKPLVGDTSLVLTSGDQWKASRKPFNAGFQPKHLQTLLPLIIKETTLMVSKIHEKVQTGEVFDLGIVTQNLAIDVIGVVVLNKSLNAQNTGQGQGVKGPTGVLTAFRMVQHNFTDLGNISPSLISPMRLVRLWYYQYVLKKRIAEMVLEAAQDSSPANRTLIKLALKDTPLNPSTLQGTADQLRTFIFAGFDTTSSLLQWAIYYLSLPSSSTILQELIEEHDRILGPDEDDAAIEQVLSKYPEMPFTMAVIKESLRLEPPASSARYIPESEEPFYATTSEGVQVKLNGAPLYINHRIMHSTPKIWGPDAKTFRPSRWLDKEYMATIPPGSFRPFERGPRACIGQELALMEAQVVLAMTVRKFAFKRASREMNESDKPWNVYNVTSTPREMHMTVSSR